MHGFMHGSANVGFRLGTPVSRFSAAKHGFNRNISLTWQAIGRHEVLLPFYLIPISCFLELVQHWLHVIT